MKWIIPVCMEKTNPCVDAQCEWPHWRSIHIKRYWRRYTKLNTRGVQHSNRSWFVGHINYIYGIQIQRVIALTFGERKEGQNTTKKSKSERFWEQNNKGDCLMEKSYSESEEWLCSYHTHDAYPIVTSNEGPCSNVRKL